MRKRISLTLAIILLLVSLLGCSSNGKGKDYESYIVTLKNDTYGTMRVTIWNENYSPFDYSMCVSEANSIMTSYLQDAYKESEIVPYTVIEMYDYPFYPRGMQFNGRIYLNVDFSIFNDEKDMIVTIVHEQLHYNGHIKVPGLSEEDSLTLSEYIVYKLSKKVCLFYSKEMYTDAYYGRAPIIPDLDSYLDELCDVYLGNTKLSGNLQTEILKAFENTHEVVERVSSTFFLFIIRIYIRHLHFL